MNIRGKLTLSFLSIVTLIFAVASITIYVFSASYREESFYDRLLNKANNTARLLIEVDEVGPELLRKLEKSNLASLPEEKVTIYDSHNNVIFSTDEDGFLNVTPEFLNQIRQNEEIRYKKEQHEITGLYYKGQHDNYVVIEGAVDFFGLTKLKNLKANLLIVNAISFVLVLVSGWIFSGQALAPIKNVINQVNEISASRLNLRVDEGNGTDEIARLAKTFNEMLDRLEIAFKIEKNFIANASHELRTPLTAITGQLEVNLMKDRTTEEYKATFRSILEDIKNINLISDKLLLLAQATAGNEKLNFVPVRVDEVLWQIKSDLQKQNPGYKINITLSNDILDDRMLIVSGNEQLLKTALANIADNGCKYSPDHRVRISLNSNGSKNVVINFLDRGIGIHDEDYKQLFEPFFRGKNALKFKGHGIGLSLSKRIITLHNGTLNVESSPKSGTTFSVALPTAA